MKTEIEKLNLEAIDDKIIAKAARNSKVEKIIKKRGRSSIGRARASQA